MILLKESIDEGVLDFPSQMLTLKWLLASPTCCIVDNKRIVIRVPKKSSYHSFAHSFVHALKQNFSM